MSRMFYSTGPGHSPLVFFQMFTADVVYVNFFSVSAGRLAGCCRSTVKLTAGYADFTARFRCASRS